MVKFFVYVVVMVVLIMTTLIVIYFTSKRRRVGNLTEVIYELLPQINCKRCGRDKCLIFAEDLSCGRCSLSLCPYLTGKNYYRCRQILKRERKVRVDKIAFVKCKGGADCLGKFDYFGDETCKSKNLLNGGDKYCKFACLGCGDCIRSCVYGAILISKKGCAIINKDKCVGCGECVAACPKKLIQLIPSNKFVEVVCNNTSLSSVVTRNCQVACSHCEQCVSICPTGAIKMIGNIPVIDKKKCIKCSKCVAVCPNHVISRI